MKTLFTGDGLLGYVDGSIKPPEKFALNERGEPTTELSQGYRLWHRYDAGVKAVINATLSSSALPHIIGSDSIDVYMGKIEEIRTKLGLGFSVTVYDAEMIAQALRGLPDEYEAFRNSITARNEPLQSTEFHVLLRAEESSILAGNQ
ncbi:hypothetical protein M0R45_034758 [Rubus argutus]|uniref:Uncharacterized protein n=1 Tax=Rubus argutus TaxID=59490 RepID=A0AAW1VSQ6_RUBAR